MKKISWRFLTICLMLVLLPVQGFAASSIVHCAEIQQLLSAQANPEQPCHPTQASADQPHDASHAKSASGVCQSGACCIGAILPSSPLVSTQVLPETGLNLSLVEHFQSASRAALERPPKYA